MSFLLNIDTAIDSACVSVSKDGHVLQEVVNKEQKEQGAFLQPAIQSILIKAGIGLHELDAIAVVAGPGSYTGLRVGMATAKGLCYALNKPLITVGTLNLLAFEAVSQVDTAQNNLPSLFCPMVDARRMELFTAVFDRRQNAVLLPCAMIINENSFANLLLKNKILFFGNGAAKWQQICKHKNAYFMQLKNKSLYMSELSFKKYLNKEFAELAYAEPTYIKEFHSPHV